MSQPDDRTDELGDETTRRPADVVPFREATRAWFGISLQTFGGPAGQIAVMHRTLVDERRWLGEQRFLHALNFCMLLPGPEAQQLAIYTGWLLNGLKGGLVAGTLFVLPGLVTLLALSALYVGVGDTSFVDSVFLGVAPAVVAIVVQAVIRVSSRALTRPLWIAVAVVAFTSLTLFAIPFPAVVLGAGVVGWVAGRVAPASARAPAARRSDGLPPLIPDDALHGEAPSARRSTRILVAGLALWWTPVLLAALTLGRDSTIVDEGLFFSGTALVTFGGAYAVLAFVAHQAVSVYGWLAPGEMVRGLALAESTPGPLIMVVQFVAFLGAYRAPGDLDPWVAATIAALLTTWVTFVPCFLFILLGAPYVERLRGNAALSHTLTGITAAVVGVIANLAVYFAVHTFFDETSSIDDWALSFDRPVWSSVQPDALAICALACALLFWRRWGVLRTLGVCALVGICVGALT